MYSTVARYLFLAVLTLLPASSAGEQWVMEPAPAERPLYEKQRKPGQFKQNRLGIIDPTPDVVSLNFLPKDKYGFVDWAQSIRDGLIKPRDSILDGAPAVVIPGVQDVVIKSKLAFMPDVLFPHSAHTVWLKCNNCHPNIFKQKAGETPITMSAIWRGQYCGRCHDKVAFPIRNCFKCHSVPRAEKK